MRAPAVSHLLAHRRCAGENWNTVMYDGMHATNSAAALYFLSIVIIGNYVVLNLFLAILLDKFAGGNEDDENHNGPTSSDSQPVASDGMQNCGKDDVTQQATMVLQVHVCTSSRVLATQQAPRRPAAMINELSLHADS